MRQANGRPIAFWLIPALSLFADLSYSAFVLPGTPVRDELVFFPAARDFAHAGVCPSLEFLAHYSAPQGPLGLYLAGRFLSLVPSLRSLRTIQALLMAGALARLSWCLSHSAPRYAALACALFALNPYYHLVATHFYSDAPYLLLVVWLTTWRGARPPFVGLMVAPLLRQSGVIFALGEALACWNERRFRDALFALLTQGPLLALFWLWQGVAPDGERSHIVRSVHAAYGPLFPYIATYHLSALGFYLAPLLGCIRRSGRFWVFGLLSALAYLLAPAHQNFSSQLAGVDTQTLGAWHRIALFFGRHGAQVMLCGASFVGGGLVATALALPGRLRYFIALFVFGSALNFQAWDKYLLEIFPALLLGLSQRQSPSERGGRPGEIQWRSVTL